MEPSIVPPRTPTSTTPQSARSEMSSRRLREMERSKKKSPGSREPLSMSGRSSGMFCTPPSLATEQPTVLTRSERVRKDASARFEREKKRVSTTTMTSTTTTSTTTTRQSAARQSATAVDRRKPPPAVVAAAAPPVSSLKDSFDKAAQQEKRETQFYSFGGGDDEHTGPATEAKTVAWKPEEEQVDPSWALIDVGVAPPQEKKTNKEKTPLKQGFYPLTSLTPDQGWRRGFSQSLADIGGGLGDDDEVRIAACRQDLLDKVVWVRLDEERDLAARVRSVVWEEEDAAKRSPGSRLLLGVDVLPNEAGLDLPRRESSGAAFVDPNDVTLLSMKELLDLPPPPPPCPPVVPPKEQQQQHNGNDENAPPPFNNQKAKVSEDLTPPQLRPLRTPSWAEPRSHDLDDALQHQENADPPRDFDTCFMGKPRTCDLAQVFQRPSLATTGYRETGDWSKDDW